MDIIPLGHAAFKLKGKQVSVVLDPYNPVMVGLKFPKGTTADIITVSHAHEDHNFTKDIASASEVKPLVFSGPGEYEAKGVMVTGVATFHDAKEGKERGKNTVFQIEIDGIKVVHCGDLGHKLTDDQLAQLDADILLVPVGGIYTVDAETAAAVVNQLEPNICIPMHYLRTGMDPKIFGQLSPVSEFLKEIGQETITPQPKLMITKDKLPAELQVVVLE